MMMMLIKNIRFIHSCALWNLIIWPREVKYGACFNKAMKVGKPQWRPISSIVSERDLIYFDLEEQLDDVDLLAVTRHCYDRNPVLFWLETSWGLDASNPTSSYRGKWRC